MVPKTVALALNEHLLTSHGMESRAKQKKKRIFNGNERMRLFRSFGNGVGWGSTNGGRFRVSNAIRGNVAVDDNDNDADEMNGESSSSDTMHDGMSDRKEEARDRLVKAARDSRDARKASFDDADARFSSTRAVVGSSSKRREYSSSSSSTSSSSSSSSSAIAAANSSSRRGTSGDYGSSRYNNNNNNDHSSKRTNRRTSTNVNNNTNTINRNEELDQMRPGERIVKAMESISVVDKYRKNNNRTTSFDHENDDDDDFFDGPVNFDLVSVDSAEVERLYASLQRDPKDLDDDDEFRDLILGEEEEDSTIKKPRVYNRNTTTTTTKSGTSYNNDRNNVEVFQLKDVARAVINPSSSLAQHNHESYSEKIEKDPNHRFGTSTINFAIKELGEKGDFSRAYALYRWMSTQAFNEESKYSPNAYTFCSLASSAKTSREVRIVLEVWRGELKIAKRRALKMKEQQHQRGGHEEKNHSTNTNHKNHNHQNEDFDEDQSWLARNECASAAIAMANKIGDWQSALEIFNDCKKIGNVRRNIYTYTAILTALRDACRSEEAETVLYEMLEEPNVRVTSLAFSLGLSAFENARNWQEGNKLAKSAFKVFQVAPDPTLTHAIITMAGKAGDLKFATETFDNMKNSTLVVTTYSYNALLGGYARYGDWINAKRIFDDLRRAHLQPDRYTYTQLISAAERAGEYEAADVVWREMLTKSRHVVPHTVMCGAYIHCLAKQRRNLEAEDVLETMKLRWDVPRNAAVYNALIGAHVRAGDVPKALQVYDRMKTEDNINATEITFAVLIRACEEDFEFVKMAELLLQAKDLLSREGRLVNDLSGDGSRGSLF